MSQVKFLVLACMFAFSAAANAATNDESSNATAISAYHNGNDAGVQFDLNEDGKTFHAYYAPATGDTIDINILPQEWGRRVYVVDSVAIVGESTTLYFKDSNMSLTKNHPGMKDVIPGQAVVYTEIASQQRGYVHYYKGWTILKMEDTKANHYFDYTPSTGKPKAKAEEPTHQTFKSSKKDNKKAKKQSQKDIDAAVAAAIGGFSGEYEIIED